MKKLIVIRHCSATGKSRDAMLTIEGEKQASALAEFLMTSRLQIDSIISSPFKRAIQSITPFASLVNLQMSKMNA
ncbi:Uncharacterized protein BC88300_04146 [Bacillus cytotoxicus]|uniref:Histidine phosphatase family protein n=1 Tax=Bacillus cytotoxicus TaxID=580165 RepID=A0AAX2CME6_9BACI|nr:Uncharacterized protein BCB44BAC_04010 [Bacillus cytotoxicus]SCN42470.1 Uncharacterized protein BC88300_04146 [Bacillus cytotoxicus]